ncbi:MmgE/PrpD family protein [Agrobacterium fabrum]|uniref:MmgE/PrpD family protein n=1 Tax=Agrobacterium fabrum TaxID=1176649 RepID=UPI001573AD8E|nr:MmgE/PrpD family protein [Agrobacterium fabrum]WCK80080.1 MmgE/PrpD family protein [Agrobacterium fabrum]
MPKTSRDNSISGVIADFILTPVPPEAYELARTRLLDAIGIGLAARVTQQAQSAILAAKTLMGSGVCRGLDGADGYSPHGAAFVNATLIHALDFDDTYLSGAIHTHPTVIPAALAIADLKGASLRDLIVATAVGTEVACWLSKAIGRDLHGKGFHPSAVLGGFGAVAAAAHLLKLDHDQIIDAIGLVGTVTSGTWQFEESWVKNWNVAVAAQNAIGAAVAASAGFKGPLQPIEGQYGLLATHLGSSNLSDAATLVGPWLSADISMKRYGACHFLQSVVGCTLDAASIFVPDEIDRVTVFLPNELAMRCVALPIETRKAPENSYRARFAGHWLVARGLLDGKVDLTTFDEVGHPDARLLDMTDRITFQIKHFDEYPDYWPAEVEVRSADGSSRLFRNDGRSSTFGPSNLHEVEKKFRENIAYSGNSSELAQGILDVLDRSDASVSDLWVTLHGKPHRLWGS